MKKVVCFLIGLIICSCAIEDPNSMTIEASTYAKRIVIDGRFTEFSEIQNAYYYRTKDLDSVQKSKFYVKLKFGKGVTMEAVGQITQELRKANALNVKYYMDEDEKTIE